MFILGINSVYHESSACLIKDGEITAAAEEERFSRKKHAKKATVDNPDELPLHAIEYCLAEASKTAGSAITLKDIAHVGYSINPRTRLAKNTRHEYPYEITPGSFGTREGEEIFYQKILDVEKKIRKMGFEGEFHYLDHHACHAASSFFVSPYENAAVLVVDGIGEFETTTFYSGDKNTLKKIEKTIDFPHSLGFLWEKMSKYLGFSEYDACKVMGLASYGDPGKYTVQFRKLVNIGPGGAFRVDDRVIKLRNHDYSGLESLFQLQKRNEAIKYVDGQNREYACVAAALQAITEEILAEMAKWLKEKTGSAYLCLSGGVALNCVANGKLIHENLFEDIFVQPASNDAGTAIGAAFYIWNQVLGNKRSYIMETPYLGPGFADEEIRAILDEMGVAYIQSDNITHLTAELIAGGNIVCWFQGRMEIGPRALGNRSILADPRNKDVVAQLNDKVKFREPFRPFCPSVLEEKKQQYFDTGKNTASPTRYMLAACDVLEHKKEDIPAVVHVDGTARIQNVGKDLNPLYYRLIQAFEEITGIPILLNTSFNNQEPIVCTPRDAVKTFLHTGIDYLSIGNFMVSKRK